MYSIVPQDFMVKVFLPHLIQQAFFESQDFFSSEVTSTYIRGFVLFKGVEVIFPLLAWISVLQFATTDFLLVHEFVLKDA